MKNFIVIKQSKIKQYLNDKQSLIEYCKHRLIFACLLSKFYLDKIF